MPLLIALSLAWVARRRSNVRTYPLLTAILVAWLVPVGFFANGCFDPGLSPVGLQGIYWAFAYFGTPIYFLAVFTLVFLVAWGLNHLRNGS